MDQERDESLFRREADVEVRAEPAVDEPPTVERSDDEAVRCEAPELGAVSLTDAAGSRFQRGEPTTNAEGPTSRSAEAEAEGGRGVGQSASLERIEGLLREIRGQLETMGRVQRYRDFSPARLIGAILQSLVVGFVIAAVADWLYQASAGTQLVKIGLAGVLQLAALTAFVLARRDR